MGFYFLQKLKSLIEFFDFGGISYFSEMGTFHLTYKYNLSASIIFIKNCPLLDNFIALLIEVSTFERKLINYQISVFFDLSKVIDVLNK